MRGFGEIHKSNTATCYSSNIKRFSVRVVSKLSASDVDERRQTVAVLLS